MTQAELAILLRFLKALADDTRLRIVGLLSSRPHYVGELAEALDLTEPTVSHHLAKLRDCGLVHLQATGNVRIYSLDHKALKRQSELVSRIEEIARITAPPKPDMAWIAALELSDEDRKVFKDYFYGTRLKQIPTKYNKLLVVLRWLIEKFAPGVTYTERDVNAIIEQVHPDYASLRRELIEAHLLLRDPEGRTYRRA
jgi:predicted transcriptional regulator